MFDVTAADEDLSHVLYSGMGMTVSSNEAEKLNSPVDKTDISTTPNEMRSGSIVPSRLTLRIYHRLVSFAVYCMSTSATAALIFLLLFWYHGGVLLLLALLIAMLGELVVHYLHFNN